ncbi:cell division protein FtsA [Alteribacillus sp. YIM 98480]|uniref:cell division protein FtsA n=1 Tax=Alteribacillus sp. YIM 98480 TaxID=2606599 RepID=UPI00131DC42C|nr:cell division protein FtsA [Alteribacillus sp. YIM 98480]
MKTGGEKLFALDIGTRSITGLILKQTDEGYELLDIETREHRERSMMDGQIHNIVAVASVIQEVKENLEERHGKLQKVCAAAAGRSLKTQRAKMEIDIALQASMAEKEIVPLELGAVQKAQHILASETPEGQSFHYHCVGYSVVAYYLDDEEIGSLVDQSGETASVDVIATFLPKVVVESLLNALQRADLVLEALTLEPIAAINVLIPPSVRRLNVALVDIGAGTSDIAITDVGTVTAYGMVPVAGDEVTESLSDHFLLDFPDAEKVKKELTTKKEINIIDILGMETTHSYEEVLQPIRSVIQQLASEISSEIITLNGKPPKAVMLVGGGSMTPEIVKHLSEALDLPENRVAVRGIDAIKNLIYHQTEPGPELVTPVGIAIAAKEHPVEYIPVKVNEKSLRLFDVKTLSVGDAILASGLSIPKLHGKPGPATVVTLNKQLVTVPGTRGEPPVLLKNKKAADFKDSISSNDEIRAEKGTDGSPVNATFKDLIDEFPCLQVTINQKNYSIPPLLRKNGSITNSNTKIKDRDVLECQVPASIIEIWEIMGWTVPSCKERTLYLNNKTVSSMTSQQMLTINGEPANMNHPVYSGDDIRLHTGKEDITVKDILQQENIQTSSFVHVTFNDKPVLMEKQNVRVTINEENADIHDVIHDLDEVKIIPLSASFIVQDVFNYADVDISKTTFQKWTLLKDGEPAAFSDELAGGEHIELKFVHA